MITISIGLSSFPQHSNVYLRITLLTISHVFFTILKNSNDIY